MLVILYGLNRVIQTNTHSSQPLDYKTWCKVKKVIRALQEDGWVTDASLFQGGAAYAITKPAPLVRIEVRSGVAEVVQCPEGIDVEIIDYDGDEWSCVQCGEEIDPAWSECPNCECLLQ